jgi:hypothetical protein
LCYCHWLKCSVKKLYVDGNIIKAGGFDKIENITVVSRFVWVKEEQKWNAFANNTAKRIAEHMMD